MSDVRNQTSLKFENTLQLCKPFPEIGVFRLLISDIRLLISGLNFKNKLLALALFFSWRVYIRNAYTLYVEEQSI